MIIKVITLAVVIILIMFFLVEVCGEAVAHGRCPMCGQTLEKGGAYYPIVPRILPKPGNQPWVETLRLVLYMEMFCKAQYENDNMKFKKIMPYRIILPQEDNHIIWLSELFNAYGLTPEVGMPHVEIADNLKDAFQHAMKLESELDGLYAWLIKYAKDDQTKRILDTIRVQNEFQYKIFRNALDIEELNYTVQ